MPEVTVRKRGFIAFVEGLQYIDGEIAVDAATVASISDCGLAIFKNVFSPVQLDQLRSAFVQHDYQHHDYVERTSVV